MSNIALSPDSPFFGLEPASVWRHFATLCRIPRQSGQEQQIRDHLQQWANGIGLTTLVDHAGNLIIRKPASAGYEQAPGVILQAHLDMVCQKNDATTHDFSRDPIKPVQRDGLLLAEDTTLGADDGIGVALILAALEDATLTHGPLEALLTVDEEEGMGGAHGLVSGILQGKYLLNLDTESWGDFYLGCAGGTYVNASRSATAEALPTGWQTMRIDVTGLRGGHSGINIHEGRGNAIKLMTRILSALQARFPLRLASFTGGSARNALPREASAIVAIRPENLPALSEALTQWQNLLRSELRGVDEAIRIAASPAHTESVMSVADQQIWLHTLQAAPHGIKRMSVSMPGNVETSINLGTVDLQPAAGTCSFMPRSTVDSACDALADEIVSLFALSGTQTTKDGYYPGWQPNPESPLLALCQKVYRQEFGAQAGTQVIHAGLECGIIGAKYPDVDIISFGPTIHNPHAPGESVEIETVAKSWQLLTAILRAVN
ncbi:MAG: aminoacyl-histidine dipeptidase [Burkholderiaceae bacterium]|nr:aminoacyl-histidine dipeptidase [Burkholderiaceae bacterium]